MEKYSYIKNEGLKIKLEETYWYIKFLFSIEKDNLETNLFISLNRDIIIHTTSILEWLLTYLILDIQKNWEETLKAKIEKSITKEEYKSIKIDSDLKIIKWDDNIFLCKKKKNIWKINSKLNFWNLIQIIKSLKLFEKEIINNLEELQDIRNDLHIQRAIDNKIYLENITDQKMLELFNFIKKIEVLIKTKIK